MMTAYWDPEAYEDDPAMNRALAEQIRAEENADICRHCEENEIEDSRGSSNVCEDCHNRFRDTEARVGLL